MSLAARHGERMVSLRAAYASRDNQEWREVSAKLFESITGEFQRIANSGAAVQSATDDPGVDTGGG